jgi:hypothetical protein
LEAFLLQAGSDFTFSAVLPNLFFRTQTSSAFNLFLRRSSQFRNVIKKFSAISGSAIDEAGSTIDAASTDEIHLHSLPTEIIRLESCSL